MAQAMVTARRGRRSFIDDLISLFNDETRNEKGELLFKYGKIELHQKEEFVLKKRLDKNYWNGDMIATFFDILTKLEKAGLLQPQSSNKKFRLIDPILTQALLLGVSRKKIIERNLSNLEEDEVIFMTHEEHKHWYLIITIAGSNPVRGIMSSMPLNDSEEALPMGEENKNKHDGSIDKP